MNILERFALWILIRRNRTVLINFKVVGGRIVAKGDTSYIYNNDLINTVFEESDGSVFDIPKGKFDTRRKHQ